MLEMWTAGQPNLARFSRPCLARDSLAAVMSGASDRAYSQVTVFGGSGFLGRQIVKRLARDGAAVRVAVRHPERAVFFTGIGTAGLITTVRADVWDEATVGPAVDGSDAVVNTVGHYVERGRATFEAIHGQGALHVARASAKAGVKRLVHISGIGADAGSPSAYVRARAIGERLVTEAFPEATILRPSVMFGPEDAFFNQLAALARVMPILPLFGTGAVKLQPVYVGDVAEAVARALATEAARGQDLRAGRAQNLHVQGAPAAASPAAWSPTAAHAGSLLCLGSSGCRDGAAAEAPDLPRPGRADETRQCGRPEGLVVRRARPRTERGRRDFAVLCADRLPPRN